MALFNNTVSSISTKVDKIANVFTKTVNDLKKVNEEIATETENRQTETLRLMAEIQTLEKLRTKNDNTITKITEFLG